MDVHMVFHTNRNKCTATYKCCHFGESQVATLIATTLIDANRLSKIGLNSHKEILSKKRSPSRHLWTKKDF